MDINPRINQLEEQVDQTKQILRDNCEKIIQRDERLHLLEEQTQNLTIDSNIFKVKSNKLKNKMWVKSKIPYFICLFIFLVIVIIIIIRNR